MSVGVVRLDLIGDHQLMISVYVNKYYRTNLRSLFYDEVTPQS